MRVLRSRRIAIILLLGLTVYAWVATWLTPEHAPAFMARVASPHFSRVSALLGFDHPFSAPVFILAVALVTVSTAACAWERSRHALGHLARPTLSADESVRLQSAHRFTFATDPMFSREEATQRSVTAVKRFGLRACVSDDMAIATGGSLGVIGSALFHWALVGVFAFAALGQLTRYEGYANVVQGTSSTDSSEGYDAELIRGPLSGESFSGLTFGVAEIDPAHQADGVARGSAAMVTLSKGDREIKRQWVYPNRPLGFGALLIHRADVHPVFLGTIRTDGSSVARQVKLHFPPDPPTPQSFDLQDAVSGDSVRVTVSSGGIQLANVAITVGGATTTQTAGVGESVEVSKGQRLTIDGLTYAAQLHVVNDWTVPWLYAMFGLGILGVSAAVFIPTRMVWMSVTEHAEGMSAALVLDVRYTCRRNDPTFPRLLKEQLEQAVGNQATPDAREDSQ
ncbi:MAG: cytochrome c biogenesis protein ResB [Actinomycetota bacterium]|nr:cytochrome c biogenesis protein ResB [Actinomycetota bacterium]